MDTKKTEVTEMKDLFNRYLRGELKEGEYKVLTGLLRERGNHDLFKQLKEQWENSPEQNELASMNWKRISYRISKDDAGRPGHSSRKITIRDFLPYAAILVIGLLVAGLFYVSNKTEAGISEIAYSTPYGARSKIVLPDSSVVWLNSGSELSYLPDFSKDRSISLAGEAYFEVRKGKKPFVVSTTYGDVEVKGTSFNVLAYPDDDIFQTTLVEGIVSLSDDRSQLTLRPGQQALYDNGFVVRRVETEYFTSWKDGKLIFKNDALSDVVRKLERWYNVSIELVDYEELSGISYTGTIEMESFSEVLQLLKVTTPGVSYTYDDSSRTIKINYKD